MPLALFDNPTIYRSELTADVSDYRQISINGKCADSFVLSAPTEVDHYEVPREEINNVDYIKLASMNKPKGLDYVPKAKCNQNRNWMVLVIGKQRRAPEGSMFQQSYTVQHTVVFGK
ncbi:hypothetical protein QR680_006526 [Steinernema hermaphroditum]|uniref:Uncharacterized protein n=1 Tax=Steinernema hermaphroditum TaxID=289476 RepID=A0AA39HXZ8_9BILA|nr:hypothetical protein QR680_006526 [Steinernema hermaphroditum]